MNEARFKIAFKKPMQIFHFSFWPNEFLCKGRKAAQTPAPGRGSL
jgi:hypothetical protein